MTNPWQTGTVDPARQRRMADAIKRVQQQLTQQAPPPKVPVPRTPEAMKDLEKDVSKRCQAAGITKMHAYDAVYPKLEALFGGLGDPDVAIPVLEEIGRIADEVAASTAEYAKHGGAPKLARERLKVLNGSAGTFEQWRDIAHLYILGV